MTNGEAAALGLIRGMELAGYSVLLAFAFAGLILIIGYGGKYINLFLQWLKKKCFHSYFGASLNDGDYLICRKCGNKKNIGY